MPRPKKCRRVCSMPPSRSFCAEGAQREAVILTVDEYESLRLADHEGFSQEECAEYMQVSRATVQLIYGSARKKLAAALVNGLSIRIEGGDYRLCGGEEACGRGGCKGHGHGRHSFIIKGEKAMRIAVTYENEMIFGHFGHTEQFKVYDVEDGRVVDTSVIDTDGQGHGALSELLAELGADVLICGGIGGGAKSALSAAGIEIFGGVSGSCDKAVEAFLAHSLSYDPNVRCSHHDSEHGDKEHTCGAHGCGKGTCGSHGCH